MVTTRFEDIQDEFMDRLLEAVYCSVATVDRKGRPRSRVLHLVWHGPVGWVITRPDSPKAKHLAISPYVSLAYIKDPMKPVYAECTAMWITDDSEKQRASGSCTRRSRRLWDSIPHRTMERSSISILVCCSLIRGGSSWQSCGRKA